MFGRSRQSQTDSLDQQPTVSEDDEVPTAQQKKGRPTPSRKDAEANRKHALKVPNDAKAAKKAMKQRDREARAEARAGMMAGDERFLPKRDQGPAKKFTRNFVDGKRRLSEFFVFVAVAILLAGFMSGPAQGMVSLVWLAITLAVALEVVLMIFKLRRQLSQRFTREEAKGCTLYAILRALQIRKLRVPPPQVRPGGEPVTPKTQD
ncbi:MAG: DUF3043 domain-containing protein [Actinobacteria bacterium]|nr:DUF3043 domain-containing protein [Actinomycetota bacterium]